MNPCTFTITFLGPFHIATGSSFGGMDSTVDRRTPIPASSLKGLMRAQGHTTLGLPPSVAGQVFGTATQPSPWGWTDADLTAENSRVAHHARLAITERGQATEGALQFADHVWALDPATFQVEQIGPLPPGALGRAEHMLILRASARAVTSLGGARRRGHGWVTIADQDPWTEEHSTQLLGLRPTVVAS